MGKIKASYVTNTGKQILFGGGTVNYTKAVLYSQDVSNLSVSDIHKLTSLSGKLMSTPVGVIDRQSGATSSVNVEAVFTNAGLDHDITFGAVGWFAKQGNDDTESLMAVQVASNGANLAASPPGGKATDAVDLTLSFAIGDATTVDAVIAPAASITPAQFNSAVNELHTALDTKADKSQLPDLTPYAKTVNVNASLDTKADKQTVADDLAKKADQSDVNERLATKADKDGVDEALSKKADKTDLDPLAKTEDVNTALDKKADKTALDDYAKSSDVAADVKQLSDSIATKADAKTVNDAIGKIDFSPYAKTADVNEKLAGKANTTDLAPYAKSEDVSKQIEGVNTAVTNASNTEKSDVDKITKALATKRDITDSYSKDQLDKKFLELSTDTGGKVDANQVAAMIENKADKSDVTKQINGVTDLVNTKASSTDVDAALDKKDDITDVDAKIKTVTDLANTKADASDVSAKIKVVTDLANTKANSSDVYTKKPVDDAVNNLSSRLGKLEGAQTLDSPDFNAITASGVYYITNNNSSQIKNNPVGQWGVLAVFNGDGHRIGQLYYPDDGSGVWFRSLDEQTWRGWQQVAITSQVNSALNGKTDKSQVNVDGTLYYADHSDHNAGSDILGQHIAGGFLKAIVNYNESPDSNALSDATTFAAGDGNAGAMVSISAHDHHAKILSYDDPNGQPNWTEDVAFKSDINNLQTQAAKAQSTADSANTNANGRLSLSGGNMNTTSVIQWNGGGIDDKTGNLGGATWSGGTDWAKIYGDQDASDNLDLAFDLGDDGSNHFSFRKNGSETSAITSDGHFTGSVDWGHVNGKPDVATKADVNSVNATVSALQQTVKTLTDTINSANATIKSLQDTVTKQATTITGLQTQVNNQAQDIAYIKANYIEGKRFSKANEAAADAWEKANSQRLAFITDN